MSGRLFEGYSAPWIFSLGVSVIKALDHDSDGVCKRWLFACWAARHVLDSTY